MRTFFIDFGYRSYLFHSLASGFVSLILIVLLRANIASSRENIHSYISAYAGAYIIVRMPRFSARVISRLLRQKLIITLLPQAGFNLHILIVAGCLLPALKPALNRGA